MASGVPIEKPAALRVRCCRCYAFGYKCEIVAIRGGGGTGRLVMGGIPNSLFRFPFFVLRHAYVFISKTLIAYLHPTYSFWCLLLCYCFCFVLFYFFSSLFCRFCLVFIIFNINMLSLDRCRCPSEMFLSSRPRTGLTTSCVTGYD